MLQNDILRNSIASFEAGIEIFVKNCPTKHFHMMPTLFSNTVLACTAMTHLTVSLKSATNVRALPVHDPLDLHSIDTVLIVHRLGCKHAELILWFGSLLPGLGVLACTEMTHLTVSAYLTVSMNRNGQMSHSGSHEVSFSHFSGRFSGFREKPLPAVKVAKSTLTHKFQDLQVQALFNTRCHGEV